MTCQPSGMPTSCSVPSRRAFWRTSEPRSSALRLRNPSPVLTEYVEAETGKGSDAIDRRPQLAAALAAAKAAKCSVVVAKLDRLSRDVANEGATVSYEIVANRGKESAENLRVG